MITEVSKGLPLSTMENVDRRPDSERVSAEYLRKTLLAEA